VENGNQLLTFEREEERQPTILGSNLVYLIVLFLLAGYSVLNQAKGIIDATSKDFYYYSIIMTVAFVGLPPLLYMLLRRMNVPKVVRIHRLGIGEFFLVVGMAVFGYGVINVLTLIWVLFLSQIGPPRVPQLPPIQTGREFLLAVVSVCVVPALVEEFMFRGLILRGYERLGRALSVILTGVLFGILHMSLATIPSIILLGIMITYTVHRTNSLWAGVTYHFVHNFISVSLFYLQNILQKFLGQEAIVTDISQIPKTALVAAVVVWSAIGLFALALFGVCFSVFHRITGGKSQIRKLSDEETKRPVAAEMIPAILGAAIIILMMASEITWMAQQRLLGM